LKRSNGRSALRTSSSSRPTPSQLYIGSDLCALIVRKLARLCRYFPRFAPRRASKTLQSQLASNLRAFGASFICWYRSLPGHQFRGTVHAVEPSKSQSSSSTRFTLAFQTVLSATISPLILFYDTIPGGYAVRRPSLLALPHPSVNPYPRTRADTQRLPTYNPAWVQSFLVKGCFRSYRLPQS
jgi:hypothetical protein